MWVVHSLCSWPLREVWFCNMSSWGFMPQEQSNNREKRAWEKAGWRICCWNWWRREEQRWNTGGRLEKAWAQGMSKLSPRLILQNWVPWLTLSQSLVRKIELTWFHWSGLTKTHTLKTGDSDNFHEHKVFWESKHLNWVCHWGRERWGIHSLRHLRVSAYRPHQAPQVNEKTTVEIKTVKGMRKLLRDLLLFSKTLTPDIPLVSR